MTGQVYGMWGEDYRLSPEGTSSMFEGFAEKKAALQAQEDRRLAQIRGELPRGPQFSGGDGMPGYSAPGAAQYRRDQFFGGQPPPPGAAPDGSLAGWQMNQAMAEGGYDPRAATQAYGNELAQARQQWLDANQPQPERNLAAVLAAREVQRTRPERPAPYGGPEYARTSPDPMPGGRMVSPGGVIDPYEDLYASYRKRFDLPDY